MILYIFVAAASVLLGLLVNHCDQVRRNGITRQQMLNGLSLSAIFLLLFGVSACRLNVGNDYAKYVEFMGSADLKIICWFLLFLLFLRFCSFCTGFTGRPTLFHLASSCLWLLAIIFSPSTPCGITWLWLWRCWRFPVCLRESG